MNSVRSNFMKYSYTKYSKVYAISLQLPKGLTDLSM